jgi:hypothetical protein
VINASRFFNGLERGTLAGRGMADSAYQFCPREIEGLVDQGLHLFNKRFRMRQASVKVKCCFIGPRGMNIEEPRVCRGRKGVNADASRFGASGAKNISECLLCGRVTTVANVKFGKEEELHEFLGETGRSKESDQVGTNFATAGNTGYSEALQIVGAKGGSRTPMGFPARS